MKDIALTLTLAALVTLAELGGVKIAKHVVTAIAPAPATNTLRVDPYYRWTTNEWVGEAWTTNAVTFATTNGTYSCTASYFNPFPCTFANYGRPFVLERLVTNRVRGATNVYLRVSRDGRTNDFQLWP